MPINVNYQPGAGAVGQVALDAGKGFYQQYLDGLALQQEQLRQSDEVIAQRERMQGRQIVADSTAQKLGLAVGQQNLVYETQNTNQRQINQLYASRAEQMAQIQAQQQSQRFGAAQREREIRYQTEAGFVQQQYGQYGRERLAAIDFENRSALSQQEIDARAEFQQAGFQNQTDQATQAYYDNLDTFDYQQQSRTDASHAEQDYQTERNRQQAIQGIEAIRNSDTLRQSEKDYAERELLLQYATGGQGLPGILQPPKEPPKIQTYTPEGADGPLKGADGQDLYFKQGEDGSLELMYDGSAERIRLQQAQAASALAAQNKANSEAKDQYQAQFQAQRAEMEAYKMYGEMQKNGVGQDVLDSFGNKFGITTKSVVPPPPAPATQQQKGGLIDYSGDGMLRGAINTLTMFSPLQQAKTSIGLAKRFLSDDTPTVDSSASVGAGPLSTSGYNHGDTRVTTQGTVQLYKLGGREVWLPTAKFREATGK